MHEEHSVPPLSKCQKALPLPSHIFWPSAFWSNTE
jgi:hypothetical protein